ncbi:MAG TPA: hypothetical protein VJL80_09735 [Aeromicrobium sp.]|nr:hypothetical protein [Aeromicrobium sp.]HKY58306.1 hypothetical protein [Aeromicrobium sp.]
MSDLVRVRVDGREFNVGRAYAAAHQLTVLDESAYTRDGQTRPVSREGGRPVKPKVSVAEAAERKAAKSAEQSDTNPPSEEN